MVDGGSSGAVVLNMWFLDREHQHHLETFLKCSFWDPIPYLLDQKLGRWKPAICVVFVAVVVNLLTIYWVVNCCNHCWNLRLTHPDPSLGFPLKRKPGAEPPQSPEGRKKTCGGMQGDGRREAEPGCKVRLLGTHTHSHRQRPGVSISPQSMAMRTLGKDQVSTDISVLPVIKHRPRGAEPRSLASAFRAHEAWARAALMVATTFRNLLSVST